MQARTFREVMAMSGDATLVSCRFETGILEITLELWEDDYFVTIYIPTEIVRVDGPDFLKELSPASLSFGPCGHSGGTRDVSRLLCAFQ